MNFKLSGKGFDPRISIDAEGLVKKFLDKQADGELFTTVELSAQIGKTAGEINKNGKKLAEYKLRAGNTGHVWGNKKTIAALRQTLKEQGFDAR